MKFLVFGHLKRLSGQFNISIFLCSVRPCRLMLQYSVITAPVMTLLSHLWTSLKSLLLLLISTVLAFFTYLIIKDSMKSLNEYSFISCDNINPVETKGFSRIYCIEALMPF